jgi:2-methylcitrate dehydratase PrpD
VLYRKGSKEDPMTDDELMDKFSTLTRRVDGRRSEQIAEIVSHIEDCDNLAGLSHLVATDELSAA